MPEEESISLFNELNGSKDITLLEELSKRYDKASVQSMINSEEKKLYIEQSKYTAEELELIQGQLVFKKEKATCEHIDLIAKELHIEESNMMTKISKLLNKSRESIESKSVNERIDELLSENKHLTEVNEKLKLEIKNYKQKDELSCDIKEINESKNQLELELKHYQKELESKERNVLKDIANRLSVKFEIETPGNFDELLNEIVNQNKPQHPEVIYVAKKKFGIRNNQFKGNKLLSNLNESEKVEVFSKLSEEQLKIIGKDNFDEYVQIIK